MSFATLNSDIKSSSLKPFRVINVKEEVNALKSVNWTSNSNKSYLIFATNSNVQLYDVARNVSIFHKSVDDGINTISVGHLGEKTTPWILCGGQSSLTGFDQDGQGRVRNV